MFSGQCQEPHNRGFHREGLAASHMSPGGPFLTGSCPCRSLTTAVLTALHTHSARGLVQVPGATTCPFRRGPVAIPTVQMRKQRCREATGLAPRDTGHD